MANHYFFCGIGGSGMLPLAAILAARGAQVSGSDRSLDAGRLAAKFDYLRGLGIDLHAQDGSGLSEGMTLVASAAVEDSVPDVARANELGLPRLNRPELLAEMLNDADCSIAVGGTSGKSTVTGMIGWMLHACGRKPTVMNGAVMKNFATPDAPFASALAGDADLFVSEVDESDGSIALYRPQVAVINNVTLDHKSMDELRALFTDFGNVAGAALVNADDEEAAALSIDGARRFGFDDDTNDYEGRDLALHPTYSTFTLHRHGTSHLVTVPMPGKHNASNALAALAAVDAAGLDLSDAIAALGEFQGLKRRYEIVGEANGITVIDDFGHNPDKAAATLRTAKAAGRPLHVLFQPHGYGPLKQMGDELAEVFADHLDANDMLYVPDPVYQGGTVEKERDGRWLADRVIALGGPALHREDRDALAELIVDDAKTGDMVLIMGARDDTLIAFAQGILDRLAQR
ncbi:UDP-N-acetylmuramate--L-alanine ligase [Sphingomicrobium clamense]|uniref:UDP-N-acetylmuramate--alanine ligase n=1 Tax=Sphingomicrobium clamense TaxID=2851013 RepID=A0ABS6V513_9SPHN|nr:Mur ligase family protein [Sphingomicrobium sp. B8]MBW0144644.1 UDP-N-acetylmuramate--alanine ligase [Sphingomicrobium sp. B8]